MVSFNFQAAFVSKIESGEKLQTIRASQRCTPGQIMHLYTGLRTKQCRLIMAKPCLKSIPVCIRPEGVDLISPAHSYFMPGSGEKADRFARNDGFASFDAMFDWFHDQYGKERFYGFVHQWGVAA